MMIKKNQATSIFEHKSGHVQIASKVEQVIESLAQQIAQITDRIVEAEAEQHQIDNRVRWQREQVQALRDNVEKLAEKVQEEQGYVDMAINTAAERNAVTSLGQAKKAHSDAIKELERTEGLAAKQITKERLRHEELTRLIAQWVHDIHEAERQKQEKESQRERALSELGQETLRTELERLEILQQELIGQQAEAARTEKALGEAVLTALKSLEDWPDHQASIARQYAVYHDDVSDLLESRLKYLQSLKQYRRMSYNEVSASAMAVDVPHLFAYPVSMDESIEQTSILLENYVQRRLQQAKQADMQ